MWNFRQWIGLAIATMMIHCGGGGSSPAPTPAPTPVPSHFKAQADAVDFNKFYLSWDQAPSNSGFELEGAIESQPFAKLHAGMLPPDVIGITITADDAMPELITFHFRLRRIVNNQPSDWASLDFLRSVRTPSTLNVKFDIEREAVNLAWTHQSIVADTVVIERSLIPEDSNNYSVIATLPISNATFEDPSLTEAQTGSYRVRLISGKTSSLPSVTSQVSFSVRAPDSFKANARNGIANLVWRNRSQKATEIHIMKNNQTFAILAPGETTFQDANLGSDFTTYAVKAVLPGRSEAITPQRFLAPPPPAGPLNLVAGSLPSFNRAGAPARDGTGTWWLPTLATNTSRDATLVSDPAMPGAAYPEPLPLPPAIYIDASGRPHIIRKFEQRVTSPFSESYFHGWRDGTAWKEELLGEGPTMTNLVFASAPDGTLHMVWQAPTPSSPNEKTHAVRTSTELIKRALPEWDGFSYPSAILAQSPSVFTGILDGPSLLEKGLDGSWNSQKLPAAGPGSWSGSTSMAFDAQGRLHCAFLRRRPDNHYDLVYQYRRNDGGWSEPEILGVALWSYDQVQLDVDPNSERLICVANLESGLSTFVKTSAEWVLQPLPGITSRFAQTGFLNDGRWWIAFEGAHSSQWSYYEEPKNP